VYTAVQKFAVGTVFNFFLQQIIFTQKRH